MATQNLHRGTSAANAPTRRSLLAGLAASPIAAIALPAVAQPTSSSAWRDAVAGYWRATDASNRYYREQMEPANERDEAVRKRLGFGSSITSPPELRAAYQPYFQRFSVFEDRYGDFVGLQMRAAEAVVFMPAPDATALVEKLHIFLIETDGCEVDDDWQAAMLADTRRLTARR